MPSVAPGVLIANRYQIVERLGVDGVGAFYRARDQELGNEIALQLVDPKLLQTAEERRQFRKALEPSRRLDHANVARIYDEGVDGSQVFVTMQHLDGLPLRKIIELRQGKQQRFSTEEIEPIVLQLCQALDYAHRTTVHGSLKPDNIIVMPDLLKVCGFGLVFGLPRKPFLAGEKSRGHGLAYFAPELRFEVEAIGRSADIYSLGVILAELLTGAVYDDRRPERLWDLAAALPVGTQRLLRRSLARQPSDRIGDALVFLDAFRNSDASGPALSVVDGLVADSDASRIPTADSADIDIDFDADDGVECDDDPTEAWAPIPDIVGGRALDALGPRSSGEAVAIAEPVAEPAGLMEVTARLTRPTTDGASVEEVPLAVPTGAPASPTEAPPIEDLSWPSSPQPAMALDAGISAPAEPSASPAFPSADQARPSVHPIPTVRGRPMTRPHMSAIRPAPPPAGASESSAGAERRGSLGLFLVALLVLAVAAVGYKLYAEQQTVNAAQIAALTGELRRMEQGRQEAERARVLEARERASTPRAPSKPAKRSPARKVREKPVRRPSPSRVAAPRAARAPVAPKAQSVSAQPPVPPVTRAPVAPAGEGPQGSAVSRAVVPVRSTASEAPLGRVISPEGDADGAEPQAAAAVGLAAAPVVTAPCPSGMRHVLGGAFSLGTSQSDPERNFGDLKSSSVDVGAYCIDGHESPNRRGRAPSARVSQTRAVRACAARGKRLCSEAEWEKACKGPRGLRYPYGNQWDPGRCATEDDQGNDRAVSNAGAFEGCRSGYGVADMSGNVAEWTSSAWGAGFVVKGGSADRPGYDARCSARKKKKGDHISETIGYRCCSDPL